MNRPLFRAAACTLAAVAATLALLAVPASSPSHAASISLSDPNCSSFSLTDNGGGNFSLTCQTSSPGTFGCSVASSASSPTLTTAVTLTATCSNATGAVTYTWGGPSGASPAGCPAITQQQATPSKASLALPSGTTALSNCSYSLSATDSAATPNTWTGNKNVSYSTGGGGGGGGGGNITCTNVSGATHVVDMRWGTSQLVTATGFGPNDIVVARFTTSAITSATGKGYIQAVEQGSSPSYRTAALSSTPCDLVGLPKVGGGNAAFVNDGAPWQYFTLVASKSGYPILQPSTTYYFNITNSTNPTCASTGICDMLITLNKPTGS